MQAHALSLLRSGEVTNFPALLRRVLDDIQAESAVVGKSATNGKTPNGDAKKVNGAGSAVGSLALPPGVVDEAIKVARESLGEVCELDTGRV